VQALKNEENQLVTLIKSKKTLVIGRMTFDIELGN